MKGRGIGRGIERGEIKGETTATITRNQTRDLSIGKRKFDQPNNNKVTLRLCEQRVRKKVASNIFLNCTCRQVHVIIDGRDTSKSWELGQ